MLTFTAAQQAVIDKVWKKISWEFQITNNLTPSTTYYWSTKTIAGSPEYEFKIIPKSFRGVKINRCKSELGIIANLTEVSFQIHNKDNFLDPKDFIDAACLITCELTDDVTTASRIWKVIVNQCTSLFQRLTFVCVDGFRKFIEGDYPTGGKVSDLFKSNNNLPNDDISLPICFGLCFIPLRLIVSGGNDYYILGPRKNNVDADEIYTIYGQKSPRAFAANQDVYTNNDYTFTQSNITDAYSIDRKGLQNNIDNGNNIIFGTGDNNYFHDMPTLFKRTPSTSGIDPNTALSLILSDVHQNLDGNWSSLGWYLFNISESTIAFNKYSDWKMEWNGAIYRNTPKEQLIANLLQHCHSTIKGESANSLLGYSVLSKISQKTVLKSDVIKSTFKRDYLTPDINNSGYVAFPDLGPESLTETDFATHANWSVTNDCDDTGGNATWTFSNGLASTLTQASGDMAVAGVGKKLYRLTYTVSGKTGSPTASITTSFAASATSLTITNGLQQTIIISAASPSNFVITSTLTAGQAFTIDDIHLQQDTPQDEMVQILCPTKEGGAMSSPSSEILELPFVRDSVMAQKLGILHFQRKLMRKAQIRFTGKATLFAIQPDDVIQIDEDDYGGTYDVLVDSITIKHNLEMEFECTQFSDFLDDYEDLSPTAITKATITAQAPISANPARMFMPDNSTPQVKSGRVMKEWAWAGDIIDDGIIMLPTITNIAYGQLSCISGTTMRTGIFTVSGVGTAIMRLDPSGVFAVNADTDTMFCIGTAATQEPLQLKNRLGATYSVIIMLWYG